MGRSFAGRHPRGYKPDRAAGKLMKNMAKEFNEKANNKRRQKAQIPDCRQVNKT